MKDPPSWSLTVSLSGGVKAAGNACSLHPCKGNLPEPHGPGRRLRLFVSSRLPIAEILASLRDFHTVSKSLGKERARVTKPCSQRWTWILLVGFLCKVFTTISCPGTLRTYLEPTCGHEQPCPNQSLSFENNSAWIQIERSWFLFHGPIVLQRDVCFFPASPGSCCCCCCLVTELCPLCDPWTAARPGFPAHHQLLETAQTHVH